VLQLIRVYPVNSAEELIVVGPLLRTAAVLRGTKVLLDWIEDLGLLL